MDSVTKIALAITSVALVAVIVVNGAQSAKVATALTNGFGTSITDAEKG